MISVNTDILSTEDMYYLSHLPEVLKAKVDIDAKTFGSVYFSIDLDAGIKQKLLDRLGLNLNGIESIPMRWIKGDTIPHIDRCSTEFEKTYLIYLTNSAGSLIFDDAIYEIQEGTSYVFNEGLRHGTIDTGLEPRLMLGPMNELGQAVGGSTTIIAPGNTTVYLRQSGLNVQYSVDQNTWSTITWPCNLMNSSPADGILTFVFTTDITLTTVDDYFYINSENIQIGSKSLNNNGTRPIITVDGVINYPGLIKNGDGSGGTGFNNIYIYNIFVSVNSSTLPYGGGWIGQGYFGNTASNNYIINCSSDGDIFNEAGGIIGTQPGSITLIGCSSSGSIGQYGGGIVGRESFTGATITCISCWSTGSIGQYGGGIVGYGTGTANIQYCYSTGAIGQNAGGICGSDTGISGSTTVDGCYSTGNIDSAGGGIIGYNSGDVSISNCYSLGDIASTAGGILGSLYSVGASKIIINCYTTGTVGGSDGYIVAGYVQENGIIPLLSGILNLFNNYSEAAHSGSGWNKVNANTTLNGVPILSVGTTWTETGTNQPYELTNMGYIPYATTNISAMPSLIRTFAQSINVGGTSTAAIVPNKSYIILQISGGDSNSYGTITIDSVSGVISTTDSTVPGIYTIYLRNNGSYNITIFELTIISNSNNTEVVTSPCCSRSMDLNGIDYEERTQFIAGNVLIAESMRREAYFSYTDYLRKKMAYAAKRN